MPRIFGYVFNPLSIYYCYDRSGALVAMIYEVSNTFGERHTYLIPVSCSDRQPIRQSCSKEFYVSPFMDMEMRYDFRMTPLSERVSTAVTGSAPDGSPLIYAAFTGRRRELSDAALLGALAAFPFLTLGVVAAIHWEAAKLMLKGLKIRRRRPVGHAGLSIADGRPRAPVSAG
jgi:DUF1365 family protein